MRKQSNNNMRNVGELSPHEKMMVKTDYRNKESKLKSWDSGSPDQTSRSKKQDNQDLKSLNNVSYTNHTQETFQRVQESLQEPSQETNQEQQQNIQQPTSPPSRTENEDLTHVDEKLVLKFQMQKYQKESKWANIRSKVNKSPLKIEESPLSKSKLRQDESPDFSRAEEYKGIQNDEEILDPNQKQAEQDYQKVKGEYRNKKLNHYLRQNNDGKAKIDEIVDTFDKAPKIWDYHERVDRAEKQDFKRNLDEESKAGLTNRKNEPISAVLSANSDYESKEEVYEEMKRSQMGSPALLHEDTKQQTQIQSMKESQRGFRMTLSPASSPRTKFNQQAARTLKGFNTEIASDVSPIVKYQNSEKNSQQDNEALLRLLDQVVEFLCDDCQEKFQKINPYASLSNASSPINQAQKQLSLVSQPTLNLQSMPITFK